MADVFALPTGEQLSLLCDEQDLTDDQAIELERVIHRVHMNVKGLDMSQEERKLVMTKLVEFNSSLTALLSVLGVGAQSIADFDEPSYEILDPVNLNAGARLAGAIKGRRRLQKVDSERKFTGLEFRTLGFVPQLIAVKGETGYILDATVSDSGGPTGDFARNGLVAALIRSSAKILGEPAKSTENGRFMVLVGGVFGICGLPEVGLAKIVERNLSSSKVEK